MNSLFDAFKYNDVPYKDLPEGERKETIERLVFKIMEDKVLENAILSFDKGERISIVTGEAAAGHSLLYDTTFPKDLSDKIASILVHLND